MGISVWINSKKTKVFIINDFKMMKYCGNITPKQFEQLHNIADSIIYYVGDNYFDWYKTFPESAKKWTNKINDVLFRNNEREHLIEV
jgi:hypothetical protein